MKKKHKTTFLLVLSCASLASSIGFATWIVQPQDDYVINNKIQAQPVAYIVGKENIKYTSIERALDVAKSGDIVLLIPPTDKNYHATDNKITPDKVTYKISRNCEIKEGVTLVVPTDKDTSATIKNASTLNKYISSMSTDDRNRGGNYGQSAQKDSTHYLRVTVQLEEGVILKNSGNLVISGYLSGGPNTLGVIGRTAHSYSQIIMGQNSQIIHQSANAKTYCFGFISEESKSNGSLLDVQRGELYVPLIIYDYRGFTLSVALNGGALSNQHCSPFNQFGIENTSVTTNIGYNGKVIGISNLYVKYSGGALNVNQNFRNEVTMIASSSDSFIQLTDSKYSSLTAHFSYSNNLMDLIVKGGINLNSINLELKASTSIKINFSTVDSFLPITNMYNITLAKADAQEDTAIYNFSKQRVKLLPGSKLTILDGCSLTASDFVVYSAFYDGTLGNGETAVNAYNSVKYPLLEGAQFVMEGDSTLNATSLGGVIYSDKSDNISATTSNVISKEAWNLTSTGQFTQPWTIDDYLEIREKLMIVPTSYLSKVKVFCGMNIFSKNNNYFPSYKVLFDGNSINNSINECQAVIFNDEQSNFKIEFEKNIYKAFNGTKNYAMNSTITNATTNSIIGVVNSGVSISNNNNGKNEFEVQSVTISCTTPLVNGEVPLYVDSSIQLRATIDDEQKAYDKIVTWTTSDDSIATVDKNGKVTGKKLGNVIIYAECGGVIGEFTTKVIPSEEIPEISTITVTDSNKNSAVMDISQGSSQTFSSFNSNNKYGNDKSIDFTLKLNDGAKWSSIEWTLKASLTGRQYINDSQKQTNVETDKDTITIHTTSGTGTSDDTFTLIVKLTDLSNGNVYTMTIKLIHKSDTVCFIKDTVIYTMRGLISINNIKSNDFIYSYNHLTGEYEYKPIAAVINHGEKRYDVMQLSFDDGTQIGFIESHGLFDIELNRYVDFNLDNFKIYVGHHFIKYDNGINSIVKLVKAELVSKLTSSYTLVSSENLNCVANGLLNITSILKGIYNIFEYDENHNYILDKMNEDIERYGLYEYSDFEDLITEKIFIDYGFKYFKVSIGKGLMTYGTLLFYINWLKSCINSGEAVIY